mmetsp:Transcript_44694/g.105195  ORF Transcript_44694/g.105195 Transcript_44694/m.105195 type:complete len:210 (-) Transcript_44694:571-1200(-)
MRAAPAATPASQPAVDLQQRQCAEDRKHRRGDAVDQSHRDALGKTVADENGRHVGDQHAQRRAGHHPQRLRVVGGHRDGGNLGLVAHLGQEKRDRRGAEHAQAAAQAGILVVELIGNERPDRHAEKGQPNRPAQHLGAQHGGDPRAQGAGRAMVDEGCGQDAQDDGDGPLETGGQHEGQQLGLVADLGQGHHAGGHQECFHVAADSSAG